MIPNGLFSWFNRPYTIRFRIVLLVTLLLFPLIAGFIWMAIKLAAANQRGVDLQLSELTARVSARVDRDSYGYIQALSAIGWSPRLLSASSRTADQAEESIQSIPYFTSLWTFSSQGKPIRTIFPAVSEAPTIPSGMLKDLASGKSAVSTVRGEGINDAHFIVAVPFAMPRRGQIGIAATANTNSLNDIFEEEGLPDGWQAAVVDQNGNYIARSHDAEKRVGTSARRELVAIAAGQAVEGRFTNTTYENVEVYNDFKRSALTGWTTFVAVPTEAFAEPARQGVTIVVIGGLVALSASLGSALFFATSIARPVRQLSLLATESPAAYSLVDQSLTEVNEVRDALAAAAKQRSLLAAIVRSSGDAIISASPDGTILSWNDAAVELFGYTAQEAIGKPKILIVPSDQADEYQLLRRRVLNGESVHAETFRCSKDGTLIEVSLNSAPVYDEHGEIIAISSILRDIRERREHEKHLRLLMDELAHRTKNQLAVIQSMATRTSRSASSVNEFVSSFSSRLQGLAASTDSLTEQNWRGADLSDLIRQHLLAFTYKDDAVELSGPSLFLSPAAAETLGLAIFELATNAAKYGALSKDTGRITIKWALMGPPPGMFVLTWTETGGPPVSMPERRGFGSTVIEQIVSNSTDGKSELQFSESGIIWTLTCPVARIQANETA